MRTLLLLTTIVFLSFCHTISGQNIIKLKPGDAVPEITFSILKNGRFENARLSDFKGKLVILDYWNIWCSSCIKAFPRLASLQAKYNSSIVILPVSFLHSQIAVRNFIAKRKGTENEIKLPLAVFESKDNSLFRSLPTTGYPYEVWIDSSGNFLKASDSNEVTDFNIETFLKEGKLNFRSKNQQLSFDRKKPLLIDNNGGADSSFDYRSIITKSIDSISMTGVNLYGIPGKTKLRLSILNRSVVDMLKYVFKNEKHIDIFSYDLYNHYVYFEGSESLKKRIFPDLMNGKISKEWQEKNSYCYDLTLPLGFTVSEAFGFMHQDIDRFFGIQTFVENRSTNCLILKRIDSADRIATKSTEGKNNITNTEVTLENRSLRYLLSSLNNYNTPILLDETGYFKNVDIKISIGHDFDVNILNLQLKKYGLRFEKGQRSLPIIIVKQKSNGG